MVPLRSRCRRVQASPRTIKCVRDGTVILYPVAKTGDEKNGKDEGFQRTTGTPRRAPLGHSLPRGSNVVNPSPLCRALGQRWEVPRHKGSVSPNLGRMVETRPLIGYSKVQ